MASDEPPVTVASCLEEASAFIDSAAAELDGLQHPAVIDLVHACKWLHAALELMNKERLHVR